MASARPSTYRTTDPGPVRLYTMRELLELPAPTWLIEDLLPAGSLIGLYGEPGKGKSFVALDMALSVACGVSWQGHPVSPGLVIYVSAEGGTGIAKRAKAWAHAHAIQPTSRQALFAIEPVVLHNQDDVETLKDRIERELATVPCLIVFDTLARCFMGDENQQQDMGSFIAAADQFRLAYGCTVLIVHHTRVDAERERGSTAFRGAADTMIAITKNDATITITCTKQKDSIEFEPIVVELVAQPETQSAVIMMPHGLTRQKQIEAHILRILQETQGFMSSQEIYEAVRPAVASVARSTIFRHLVRLVQRHETTHIIKENGKYGLRLLQG